MEVHCIVDKPSINSITFHLLDSYSRIDESRTV